jgi:histone deacetylase 1/2
MRNLMVFFLEGGHHTSCLLSTCSPTNGSVERKYCHIVEVGLALLAHASMPSKFWDEAFLTTTFLNNMLPSKVINLESPAEHLLHIKPNYDALHIFGCACWPNLRPYNKRKLAFRFKQCVFLGYSPLHKGVKCLDFKTGHVYISRDVVFDKNIYPFAALHPNAGSLLRQEILLLPSTLSSSSEHVGAPNTNDYIPVVVLPTNTT